VSVFFDNPDPAVRDEMMWVTVIDYHSASDRYLGVLLNAPFNLTTVKARDNIVFRYDSDSSELRALTAAGRYDFVGIPQRAQSGALAQVWEGVRQYRLGNYGHDQEAIKSCIATLSTATPLLEQSVAPADRYLAHFVLGRCHAEAYNTDLAIENFRKAISYRATDVDAHMALLAEYSLKVHPPVDQPKELHDDRWEPLFIEQLKYVREHFHADAMVGTATTIIFDESEISDLSELSAEEIARRRKVGFGVFRWKRH